MGERKPRVWFVCDICGKRFSENPSNARKRLNRPSGNKEQCCSEQCANRSARMKKEARTASGK